MKRLFLGSILIVSMPIFASNSFDIEVQGGETAEVNTKCIGPIISKPYIEVMPNSGKSTVRCIPVTCIIKHRYYDKGWFKLVPSEEKALFLNGEYKSTHENFASAEAEANSLVGIKCNSIEIRKEAVSIRP